MAVKMTIREQSYHYRLRLPANVFSLCLLSLFSKEKVSPDSFDLWLSGRLVVLRCICVENELSVVATARLLVVVTAIRERGQYIKYNHDGDAQSLTTCVYGGQTE